MATHPGNGDAILLASFRAISTQREHPGERTVPRLWASIAWIWSGLVKRPTLRPRHIKADEDVIARIAIRELLVRVVRQEVVQTAASRPILHEQSLLENLVSRHARHLEYWECTYIDKVGELRQTEND
jgi:hypothetical protein